MEENQKASLIGLSSNAISQAWIDIEHGEMTLLVGKEKIKFNLHQSIQITDEENNYCMRIESSFLPFEEQAPKILQEDALEGYELKTNSFPTKELDTHIPKVEEIIFTIEEDEEGVLATMEEGPKRRSQTSPMSLAGL